MDEYIILDAVSRYDDSVEFATQMLDPLDSDHEYEWWRVYAGNWNYDVTVQDGEIIQIQRDDGQLFRGLTPNEQVKLTSAQALEQIEALGLPWREGYYDEIVIDAEPPECCPVCGCELDMYEASEIDGITAFSMAGCCGLVWEGAHWYAGD